MKKILLTSAFLTSYLFLRISKIEMMNIKTKLYKSLYKK